MKATREQINVAEALRRYSPEDLSESRVACQAKQTCEAHRTRARNHRTTARVDCAYLKEVIPARRFPRRLDCAVGFPT